MALYSPTQFIILPPRTVKAVAFGSLIDTWPHGQCLILRTESMQMRFTRCNRYTLVPITKDAVTEDQETLVDPKGLLSSSFRLVANKSPLMLYSTDSSQSSTATFDFPYTNTLSTGGSNIDATRISVFYITNAVHDYVYKYDRTSYNCADEPAG
ncbi:hypothetical protein EDD85DRAFT_961234 [Armillaria nabsnona]|nr:hypothetical protein EDD85DRAFT_961234 [Armillaria nabsnona]